MFKRASVNKPYTASITVRGQTQRLGSFSTAEDAHAAYMAEKVKHYTTEGK